VKPRRTRCDANCRADEPTRNGDYVARYDEAARKLGQWVARAELRWREDATDGLENAPRAFIGMLNGERRGKTLVKVEV
jgi:NADPH-dependent curcumin reductase CurA